MNTTAAARPARSERKARGSGHLRRAELLAAAERIFTKEGYEGATIRKIAEEVGVSSTAIYMYFQDKSQIMLEICVGVLGDLEGRYATICAGVADPVEGLRGVLREMLRFGFEQPTAYQLLYCVVPRELNERRNALIGPYSRRCFGHVQSMVEAAISAGLLRPDLEARAVAEALVSACHGAISIRLGNPYAPWADAALVSDTLLDGLFQGFRAV